jgi:hypothetical protein
VAAAVVVVREALQGATMGVKPLRGKESKTEDKEREGGRKRCLHVPRRSAKRNEETIKTPPRFSVRQSVQSFSSPLVSSRLLCVFLPRLVAQEHRKRKRKRKRMREREREREKERLFLVGDIGLVSHLGG